MSRVSWLGMFMSKVLGVGVYEWSDKYCARFLGKKTREYVLWTNMLKRCYYANYHKKQPTYIGCTVSDNFKNFQYFAEWCNNQVGFGEYSYELDKDLLLKNNKIYCEDLCVFVPKSLNNFLSVGVMNRGQHPVGVYYHKRDRKFRARVGIGSGNRVELGSFITYEEAFVAYKAAKEGLAKQLAMKWQSKIDPRVIKALNNFIVDLTD